MAEELEKKEETLVEEPKWEDPGTLEGMKKDPRVAQESLTEEHPRFKEVYGKMKSFERQVEEIKKAKSDTERMIEAMRSHNERLVEALERSSKAPEPKDETQSKLEAVEERIKSLRTERKAAMEDLKYDRVEELESKIEDLLVEKMELKLSPKKEEPKKTETGPSPEDRAAVDAFQQISWFQEDPIMRGAAIQVDQVLLADPKWQTKPAKERLDEVRKRVEKRFGVSSKEESSSTPFKREPAVDGGGSMGGSGGTGTTLTEDEIMVAKGLRITPEQYLRQKQLSGGIR